MSRSTFTRAYDGSEDCGDFVEYIDLGYGAWIAMMGDVAGRGYHASMVARRLHAYARSLICRNLSPRGVVENCNSFYERRLMNDITPFASLFVACASGGTNGFTYVSAGHDTALLMSRRQHIHLATTGPLLGLELGQSAVFNEASVASEDDTLLVLVSDGITDARRYDDPDAVPFGTTGVVKAVTTTRCPAEDLSRAIYTCAVSHVRGELVDDASVLVASPFAVSRSSEERPL